MPFPLHYRLNKNQFLALFIAILTISLAQNSPAQEIKITPAQKEKVPVAQSQSAHLNAAAAVEAQIVQALKTKFDAEVVETSLADTLAYFAHAAKVPLLIDEAALAEEGIELKQTVSLDLKTASVEQALHFLLRPLELTWMVKYDALFITTRVEAEDEKNLVTKVYNVRKLLPFLESTKPKQFERGEVLKPHQQLERKTLITCLQ